MSVSQLFGIIPTGCSVITVPTSSPSPSSFIFNLPQRPFSHVAVFLLPGITLPPDSAAAVYLAISASPSQQNLGFEFLGGIGHGKESAIFKVREASSDGITRINVSGGEVDMDAPEELLATGNIREMIIGISVESSSSVAMQMSSLSASRTRHTNEHSNALVVAQPPTLSTLQLAQRIIKSAFNFLASFSGNIPVPGASGAAGVEVVPLKAFEDWWKRFESRVRSDPGFLERDND